MLNVQQSSTDPQEARAFLEETIDGDAVRAPSYIPAGIDLPRARRSRWKNAAYCDHPFGVFDRQFSTKASKNVKDSLKAEELYLGTLDNEDESYDPENDMIDEIDGRFDNLDAPDLHDYKVVYVRGPWSVIDGPEIVLRRVHPVPEPVDPEERKEARTIRPPAFQSAPDKPKSVPDKPKYKSNRMRGRKPIRFVRERITAALV